MRKVDFALFVNPFDKEIVNMSINVYNFDETNQVKDFDDYTIQLKCRALAQHYASLRGNTATVEELYDAIYGSEKYNERRYAVTDQLIGYEDEIESIEDLGVVEDMYDISVAGDQLFYANGILTKNSAGLPATADFMLGVIETEMLAQEGVQIFKQIKSRYGDKNMRLRFPMAVNKQRQTWAHIEQDMANQIITESGFNSVGPINQTVSNVSKKDLSNLAANVKFT